MQLLIKLVFIVTLSFCTLFATQKNTDSIAQISAVSLYNIDKNALQQTVKAYIRTHKEVRAIKIVESLSNETYFQMYNKDGSIVYDKEITQKDIEGLVQYKSLSKYEDEVVGEIIAYFKKSEETLSLNNNEIQWIKTNPVIEIAVVNNYPPFDFEDQNGKLLGFHSDIIRQINKNLGTNIVLVPFNSWTDAYSSVVKGTVNSIFSLSWSKEREEKHFDYSSAYHFTPYHLVVRKNENRINSLKNLTNMKISVEKDTIFETVIKDNVPEAKIIFVKDTNEAYKSVQKGLVKATISPNINKKLLNEFDLKISSDIYHKSSELYIGTNKKFPIVSSILKKGLNSVSLKDMANLRQKWFEKKINTVKLTEKEKEWLSQHPDIILGADKNWQPFDFMDKYGKHTGFNADYIQLLREKLGINIKIELGNWDELQEKVKNKELSGLVGPSKSKDREEYMQFTQPYFVVQEVILIRKNQNKLLSLEELENKTLGIKRGSSTLEYFVNNYPKIKLKVFDTQNEILRATSLGQVDAGVSNIGTASYEIEKNFISNIKVGYNIKELAGDSRLGVRKDWPELTSILQKGIDYISREEVNKLLSIWLKLASFDNEIKINLTKEEKEWLKANPIVKVIKFFDEPPFTLNREPKEGYLYELVEYLVKSVGLKIEYIDGYSSYSSMLDSLEAGEVDILSTYPTELDFGKDSNIKKSRSVLKTPFVIIGKSNDNTTAITEDLYGKKVAVVKGYAQDNYLSKFPEITKVHVSNNDEGFEAIRSGKADFYINNRANSEYILNKSFATDLRIIFELDYQNFPPLSLSFAMNGKKEKLVSILNKSLDEIPYKKIKSIRDKWIISSDEKINKVNLTKEEKDWVKKHPKIRVHNEQLWAPFNFYDKGKARGLSIDYIKTLASKIGIEVEFITGPSWDEFMTMSKNKDIDVMLNIVKSKQREEFLNFTKPYNELLQSLYIREGKERITKTEQLFGKTFAVPKGFYYEEKIKEFPEIKILRLDNILECLQAVSSGKADAMLDLSIVVNYYINKYHIQNVIMGGTLGWEGGALPLSIGVREDWPELVPMLNKALNALSDKEIEDIENKWLNRNSRRKDIEIYLSKKEELWLKNQPKVSYIFDSDWPPFEWENDIGKHVGMVSDVLNLIQKRTGIEFSSNSSKSWSEGLRKLENGIVNMASAMAPSKEREKYLNFTDKAIFTIPNVFVTRESIIFPNGFNSIGDKKIALIDGYLMEKTVKKDFPDLKYSTVRNIKEGFEKLLNNEIDIFVANQATVKYMLNQNRYKNLNISYKTNYTFDLKIPIRKDFSPEALSIIEKGLATLTDEDLSKIYEKWSNISKDGHNINDLETVSEDLKLSDILPIKELFIGFALFIIIFLLIWKYQIKGANKDATLKSTLFIIIGLFLFFASIITIVTLQNIEKSQKNEIKESLKSVLNGSYKTIKIWVDAKFRRIDIVLDSKNLDEKIAKFNEDKNLLEEIEKHFKDYEKVFEESNYYLISKDLNIILSNEKDYTLSHVDKESVKKMLLDDSLNKLVIFPSKDDGHQDKNIYFMKKIKDNNKTVAFLVMNVDPKKEFTRILQNGKIGKSGETYAFNKKLELISNSRFDDQLRKMNLLEKGNNSLLNISVKDRNSNPTLLAKKALEKTSGLNIEGYKDYRNITVYGAWIWDDELNIAFATEIDEKEAMGAFGNMKKTIIIIVFSIILFTIFLTILVAWISTNSKKTLEKANNDLSKLLSSFDENVIFSTTNTKGIITHASKAFCEISGYLEEELVGQAQNKVRHPDMPKEVFKELWKTIQSGESWKGEIKNKTKDGGFYWVDAIIKPEFDDNQNIIGYSAIRQNITSRKEAEELSEKQTEQLNEIQKFQALTVGREGRMIELKETINNLSTKLNEPLPFAIDMDSNDFIEEKIDNKKQEISDVIDISSLQGLLDNFCNSIEIASAIIDLKGNILASSRWQKACTDFHRANEKSCANCVESDTDLSLKLEDGEEFSIYKCKNGLVDCASPIIIEGEHLANVFIGQFLIEKPDMQFFKEQSDKFGFNQDSYIKAIGNVPIIDEKKLPFILKFLSEFTRVITSLSIEKLKANKADIANEKVKFAAINLAEDANLAKSELIEHQEHLEELILDRTKELNEAKSNLENVSNAITDLIFYKDLDLKYTGANNAFCEFMGLKEEEIIGKTDFDIFENEEAAKAIYEIDSEVIRTQKSKYFEETVPNAKGELKILSTQKHILKNKDGIVYGMGGSVADITALKKAQEEISKNKLFVDTLLNSQEQIVITTDGETLKSCNDAFLNFFTLENIEEFTKDYDCICDRFEIDETNTYLQKYMAELSWIEYVLANENETHKAVIKKDGIACTFTVTAAKLPIGDGDLMSAVFTDITELELQKKQTDSILSSVLLPMLITSKETRKIVYANSFAESQYETTLTELIGLDIEKLYTSENQRDVILNELNTKGIIQNLESRYKTLADNEFDALLSLVEITYGGEECYLGVASDISEQKNREVIMQKLHKNITDSIEYASLIQHSLIPDNNEIKKYFDEYFTIWHPKDIVGGDIYLFEELRNQDECLLMVIDCTGHGVPGAFVTMLVKAIERQIIGDIMASNSEVSPAKILQYFNMTMKKLLKQESNDSISNAGFDGGIFYYNRAENYIKYSGAETPLFYIQDDKLNMIKTNRHSIGYKKSDINYEFDEYKIDIDRETRFYISTDGYFDQIGGKKGFPFGKRSFKELIFENHTLPFADQQELLLYKMQDYQNDEERNDDMTLVGIKLLPNNIKKKNSVSWDI